MPASIGTPCQHRTASADCQASFGMRSAVCSRKSRQATLLPAASRSTVPSSVYWKSGTRMVKVWLTSMRLPELRRPALADEEVEIDALVGLQYMVDVELGIAALVRRLEALPGLAPTGELVGGDVEMQPALLYVE